MENYYVFKLLYRVCRQLAAGSFVLCPSPICSSSIAQSPPFVELLPYCCPATGNIPWMVLWRTASLFFCLQSLWYTSSSGWPNL